LTANSSRPRADDLAAILGLQAMASMLTSAPLRLPASANYPAGGMASISHLVRRGLWPSTRRCWCEGRNQMQRRLPQLRSWLRRDVLPSMATISRRSGQHSRPGHEAGREQSGSSRFISVRNHRAGNAPVKIQIGLKKSTGLANRRCPRIVARQMVAQTTRSTSCTDTSLAKRAGHPHRSKWSAQRRRVRRKAPWRFLRINDRGIIRASPAIGPSIHNRR